MIPINRLIFMLVAMFAGALSLHAQDQTVILTFKEAGVNYTRQIRLDGTYFVMQGEKLTLQNTGSGVFNITMFAGAVAPNGTDNPCAAPTTSSLTQFRDTVTYDLYTCVNTNTWKRQVMGGLGDVFEAIGGTKVEPSSPSAGTVHCYYSTAQQTLNCKNAAGAVYTAVLPVTTEDIMLSKLGVDGILVGKTLPNCNATTEKHRWNTTSHAWECATDGSGSSPTYSTPGIGFTWAAPTYGYVQDDTPVHSSLVHYQQFKVDGYNQRLGLYAFFSQTGTGWIAFAIYDSNCAVVANTSTRVQVTTNQAWSIAPASPPTLAAGIYYLGYGSDSGTLTIKAMGEETTGIISQILSYSTLRVFTGASTLVGATSTLAMPATCGIKSFANVRPAAVALLP